MINIIEPTEFPIKEGESWWVVHPNLKGCNFKIPQEAVTCCLKDFQIFQRNLLYKVSKYISGWVAVSEGRDLYAMPEYVFARYFDAEIFVQGSATPEEIANAKPFDYTKNVRPRQLELFED